MERSEEKIMALEIKIYNLLPVKVYIAIDFDVGIDKISFFPLKGKKPSSDKWIKMDKFVETFYKTGYYYGLPLPLYTEPDKKQMAFLLYLQNILPGKTKTYGEVAFEFFGNRNYARATGKLLNKNRWPLLFPCHRVVSKKDIGGFSAGVAIKEMLLEREKHLR